MNSGFHISILLCFFSLCFYPTVNATSWRNQSSWSNCLILLESNQTCGIDGFKYRTSLECVDTSSNQTAVNCPNKPYEVEKCFEYCADSCSWSESKWNEWSECQTEHASCGNGLKSSISACVCGPNNETQSNTTICGNTPPVRATNCYKVCPDVCNSTAIETRETNDLHFVTSVITGNFTEQVYISSITIESASISIPQIQHAKDTQYSVYSEAASIKTHSAASTIDGTLSTTKFTFNPPVLTKYTMISFEEETNITSIIWNFCNTSSYGEWSKWSECNGTVCGSNGLKNKSRNCFHNGQKVDEKFCIGSSSLYDWCIVPCYNLSSWINTTGCLSESSCGYGNMSQHRVCFTNDTTNQVDASKCNASDGGYNRTLTCLLPTPCYHFSQWSYWQTFNNKTFYRERLCFENGVAVANTNLCPGSNKQEVDLTEWTKWNNCSKECGGGVRRRKRECSPHSSKYDHACASLQLVAVNSCNNQTCYVVTPTPMLNTTSTPKLNTTSTPKLNTTSTPMLNTTSTPKLNTTYTPTSTNKTMVFNSTEEYNNTIVYKVIILQNWTLCSVTCGHGVRTLQQRCVDTYNATRVEWKFCNESTLETLTEECHLLSCEQDADDIYEEWSPWGECSEKCGKGIHLRSRQCSNSSICSNKEEEEEKESCFLQSCPVNGGWSSWEPWNTCSKECGIGMKTRVRTCTEPSPNNGGRECYGISTMTDECNAIICAIDGRWSDWSNWDTCNQPCNGGTKKRRRLCNQPAPEFGGKICEGNKSESIECNTNLCKYSSAELTLQLIDEPYYAVYSNVRDGIAITILKEKIFRNIQKLYDEKLQPVVIKDIIINSLHERKP